MSTPIKGSQDPLMYAPPWARERAQVGAQQPQATNVPPAGESFEDIEMQLPPARLEGSPFEGDVAIVKLRRRLSLDPDLVPDHPFQSKRPMFLRRLGHAASRAAAVFHVQGSSSSILLIEWSAIRAKMLRK